MRVTLKDKIAMFTVATAILYIVKRIFGFKAAVLVGLAINSADINEVREKI